MALSNQYAKALLFLLYFVPLHNAARLTRSVRVACPNEPVRYECTLEGSRLKWKVIPRSANRMEQTFSTLNHQPNSSLDLTWSGFHVNLTLVSVTATTMTSTAEFLAVPEFRGTRFQCFGQHTNGELVLDIASPLPSIEDMQFEIQRERNHSLLKLSWNVPLMNGNIIDYYMFVVNQRNRNLTSPAVNVTLPHNGSTVVIALNAVNCLGNGPVTTMSMKIAEPSLDETDTQTLSNEPHVDTTDSQTVSNEPHLNETDTYTVNSSIFNFCSTGPERITMRISKMTVSIFITVVVVACIVSSILTASCVIVIMCMIKVKNQKVVQQVPIYEEIDLKGSKRASVCIDNSNYEI